MAEKITVQPTFVYLRKIGKLLLTMNYKVLCFDTTIDFFPLSKNQEGNLLVLICPLDIKSL